ncbi:MAG: hypothetical protein IV084_02040 [Rugosibacter sp.]|nr:hypothetical protein [Rugosibacter sp.]
MGLLDGFEKLINEHGSAVILKERIALANDKRASGVRVSILFVFPCRPTSAAQQRTQDFCGLLGE